MPASPADSAPPWVVLLHGGATIPASIMGIMAGNETRGHRFHTSGPITIGAPLDYLDVLEKEGYVIADFERRLSMVRQGVAAAATEAGGFPVGGDDLYDEVTALVEWPVPVVGSFDPQYLELPREAVVSTLTSHQRYFPVADKNDELLPKFITVANLESKDPDQVRDGNERVIRPRLADAAFFWESDRRIPLSARAESLREVVYQRGLGSLHDKALRTADLGATIADTLKIDAAPIRQAALLAKCDLVTGMVGEFPELQGVMGRYYALQQSGLDPAARAPSVGHAADTSPAGGGGKGAAAPSSFPPPQAGEVAGAGAARGGRRGDATDEGARAVADAIRDHYKPVGPSDVVPSEPTAIAVALADKLDTLVGFWAIDEKPTGSKDPYALRRAALGVIRLILENGLRLSLVDRMTLPDLRAAEAALRAEIAHRHDEGRAAPRAPALAAAGAAERRRRRGRRGAAGRAAAHRRRRRS